MENNNGKVLYSLREAAEQLSIGPRKLRDLARKGKIRYGRLGDNPERAEYKFTQRDLEAFAATIEWNEAMT